MLKYLLSCHALCWIPLHHVLHKIFGRVRDVAPSWVIKVPSVGQYALLHSLFIVSSIEVKGMIATKHDKKNTTNGENIAFDIVLSSFADLQAQHLRSAINPCATSYFHKLF